MGQTYDQTQDLLAIVSELAQQYLGGEHTSMTYEQAQALMNAVLYCIRAYETSASNALETAYPDPKIAYPLGRQAVIDRFQMLQEKYVGLVTDFEDYGLECLKETIHDAIPAFFEKYDIQYAPQETMITLDYPLLNNIQELSGVDAVLEYVRCIASEQRFLKKFDTSYVMEILRTYHNEYESLMENICGIVLQNTIGHMVLRQPLHEKGFGGAEYQRIEQFFKERSDLETEQCLQDLLAQWIEGYFGNDQELFSYLCCGLTDIAVRIRNNTKHHSLETVFLL